jgi:hypothetical protein
MENQAHRALFGGPLTDIIDANRMVILKQGGTLVRGLLVVKQMDDFASEIAMDHKMMCQALAEVSAVKLSRTRNRLVPAGYVFTSPRFDGL